MSCNVIVHTLAAMNLTENRFIINLILLDPANPFCNIRIPFQHHSDTVHPSYSPFQNHMRKRGHVLANLLFDNKICKLLMYYSNRFYWVRYVLATVLSSLENKRTPRIVNEKILGESYDDLKHCIHTYLLKLDPYKAIKCSFPYIHTHVFTGSLSPYYEYCKMLNERNPNLRLYTLHGFGHHFPHNPPDKFIYLLESLISCRS